jgi:PTS system cellobiose-specific IIC component
MQGGWKIAVFQVFAVALSGVIYYPFFKLMDKQALANERSASTNSTQNQEVFSMSNIESNEG